MASLSLAGAYQDATLRIFVARDVHEIAEEAPYRQQTELRRLCQAAIDSMRGDNGDLRPPPLPVDAASQVLALVSRALDTNAPGSQIPALRLLARLVVHGHLAGESTPGGRSGDGTVPGAVIQLACRTAVGSPSRDVQLAATRLLLTATTSEHLHPHGDTLALAVRNLFSLALSSPHREVAAAAGGAALQAVGVAVMRAEHASAERQALAGDGDEPWGWRDDDDAHGDARDTAAATSDARDAAADAGALVAGRAVRAPPAHPGASASPGSPSGGTPPAAPSSLPALSPVVPDASARRAAELASLAEAADLRGLEHALRKGQAEPPLVAGGARGSSDPTTGLDGVERAPALGGAGAAAAAAANGLVANVAQGLAQIPGLGRLAPGEAERPDLTLLLGGTGADDPGAIAPYHVDHRNPGAAGRADKGSGTGESGTGGSAPGGAADGASAPTPSVESSRGMERAEAHDGPPSGLATLSLRRLPTHDGNPSGPPSPADPRHTLLRDSEARRRTSRRLSPLERDVVATLGSLCRQAGREVANPSSQAGQAAVRGRLLALQLLARVLGDPRRDWAALGGGLAAQLRAPLCLALLRNACARDVATADAAASAFLHALQAPRLRAGAKAELGALYSLLVLRPLEDDRSRSAGSPAAAAAAAALLAISASPRMLVDVFVNFDCSLQASNLFERGTKALARSLRPPPAGLLGGAAAASCAHAQAQARSPAPPERQLGPDGYDATGRDIFGLDRWGFDLAGRNPYLVPGGASLGGQIATNGAGGIGDRRAGAGGTDPDGAEAASASRPASLGASLDPAVAASALYAEIVSPTPAGLSSSGSRFAPGARAAPPPGAASAAPDAEVRELAARAITAAVDSLDAWAGPLRPPPDEGGGKEGAEEGEGEGEGEDGGEVEGEGGGAGDAAVAAPPAAPTDGDPFPPHPPSTGELSSPARVPRPGEAELALIAAAKETKMGLASGVETFRHNPRKGLKALRSLGLVPADAAGAARWLRRHRSLVGAGAVGELFGEPDESSLAVMHAWVDAEDFAGLDLDEALRALLRTFRLPGEAQKIDRIVQKFADRFVAQNPGSVASADGAYVLAFAVVMLNTDAHNPLAERRISRDDFVSMAIVDDPKLAGGEGEADPGRPPIVPEDGSEGAAERADAPETEAEGAGAGGAESSSEDGVLAGALDPSPPSPLAPPSKGPSPSDDPSPRPPPHPSGNEEGEEEEEEASLAPPGMVPILPKRRLLALYDRVVATPLSVDPDQPGGASVGIIAGAPATGEAGAAGGGGGNANSRPAAAAARLASALGLPGLGAPLVGWDKARGAELEARRQAEVEAEVAASGGLAGNRWLAAVHSEHARPMLLVSEAHLLAALGAMLHDARAPSDARRAVATLGRLASLAALLRSPAALLGSVRSLAASAGLLGPRDAAEVAAPGGAGGREDGRPPSRFFEAYPRGVGRGSTAGADAPAPGRAAALPEPHPVGGVAAAAAAALVRLAASPRDADLLGDAWLPLLRALSELEAARERLAAGGVATGVEGARPEWASDVGAEASGAGPAGPAGAGAGASGFSTKLLGVLGLAPAPAAPPPPPEHAPVPVTVAAWAEGIGAAEVERAFSSSPKLSADGAVAQLRALCAASREELDGAPGAGGVQPARPRTYLLRRTLEVALANSHRVRIVWARLWALAANHLVAAACHPDPRVALLALDALRQLATRRVERPELPSLPHQREALRPFREVLRHSDHAAVRLLAVESLASAATAAPGGLASGWPALLAALAVGVGDGDLAVAHESLRGLASAAEALFAAETADAAPAPAPGGIAGKVAPPPAADPARPPPPDATATPRAGRHPSGRPSSRPSHTLLRETIAALVLAAAAHLGGDAGSLSRRSPTLRRRAGTMAGGTAAVLLPPPSASDEDEFAIEAVCALAHVVDRVAAAADAGVLAHGRGRPGDGAEAEPDGASSARAAAALLEAERLAVHEEARASSPASAAALLSAPPPRAASADPDGVPRWRASSADSATASPRHPLDARSAAAGPALHPRTAAAAWRAALVPLGALAARDPRAAVSARAAHEAAALVSAHAPQLSRLGLWPLAALAVVEPVLGGVAPGEEDLGVPAPRPASAARHSTELLVGLAGTLAAEYGSARSFLLPAVARAARLEGSTGGADGLGAGRVVEVVRALAPSLDGWGWRVLSSELAAALRDASRAPGPQAARAALGLQRALLRLLDEFGAAAPAPAALALLDAMAADLDEDASAGPDFFTGAGRAPRLRQYVEGSAALLAGCERLAAGGGEAAPEAARRLAELVVDLLSRAAARAARPGAAPVPDWEEALRGALTCQALEAYCRLGPDVWAATHDRAWPALAGLIRARSTAVRQELRRVLDLRAEHALGPAA